MKKMLTDIVCGLDGQTSHDLAGLTVEHLTCDSRQVRPGSLFVCLRGLVSDGHHFIPAAVDQGAVAIVADRAHQGELAGLSLPVFLVDDTRQALGTLASAFYGHPSAGLQMIGLTGTNGKTTTSYLLEAMLEAAGHRPGVIGTVNYRFGGQQYPARFTTPEAVELQCLLREMADHGVTHVIMECSSHALALHRLQGVNFDSALFTNLTRDHLDFHGDMARYYQAKRRLFTDYLREGGSAAILLEEDTADEPNWGKRLLTDLQGLAPGRGWTLLTCGIEGANDISARGTRFGIDQTQATITVRGEAFPLRTNLVGRFNLKNVLGAIGVAVGLGLPLAAIRQGLTREILVPGRLQRVGTPGASGQPVVFVDYAHTPDALDNVLTTLRQLGPKRLVVVFGCGGDRDPGKRQMMGEIAGRLADVTIITADNSRSEETASIIAQIEAGLVASGTPRFAPPASPPFGYATLADRAQAIALAIGLATAGDIVLISGKGHEDYQTSATGTVFFDDRVEALGGLRHREEGGEASPAPPAWQLRQLLLACGGRLLSGPPAELADPAPLFGRIVTDSRTLGPGDLFLALRGETFDGAAFAGQAVERGAAGLIVDRPLEPVPPIPVILVEDTLRALGDLAQARRQQMPGLKVAAITGSSGKTTTKEMTALILARCGQTIKTQGNFNNLIGLPLSLLPVGYGHRFAVLEMGMNAPGEIARLTEIADPDVACITNVHPAHLAGLGTIEGVARAKGELFASCRESATLIVNLDDPLIGDLAHGLKRKTVSFGWQEEAEVWASEVRACGLQGIAFSLHCEGSSAPVQLQALGRHNVTNALAAAACALSLGADLEAIVSGLEAFAPGENRLGLRRLPCGLQVINDSYNANPASMNAALAAVGLIRQGVRTVAVLGDMLELAEFSAPAHTALGRGVAEQGFDYLFAVGDYAQTVVQAARQAGMGDSHARCCQDKEEAAAALQGLLDSGHLQTNDLVLVKGSRGMRMEQVLAALSA